MPRTLNLAAVVALMVGLASSVSAQPFVVVYASQAACDLSATPLDPEPTTQPFLPRIDVPVGGTVVVDLCFIVWPLASTPEGQTVCNPNNSSGGTESCAEQVEFVANNIEVVAFTPTPASGQEPFSTFPRYDARHTASSLKIAGGNPLGGLNASGSQGLRWGTVTLKGLAPAGTFAVGSIGGYVNSSMQRVAFPSTVVVSTVDLCGDSNVDAPIEDCDDGNSSFGDGCSPGCQDEVLLEMTGSLGANPAATLDVSVGTLQVVLDLSFFPNEPASGVVFSLVENFNGSAQFDVAAQVDANGQSGSNGRFMVADEEITATLTGDTGGSLDVAVPEPGQLLMLAAGIALLMGLERRRRGATESL
jgi:cysteine-rich repeat protein